MGSVTCIACEARFFSETIREVRGPAGFVVFDCEPPGPYCPSCAEERTQVLPSLEEFIEQWGADLEVSMSDLDDYVFKYHSDRMLAEESVALSVLWGIEKAQLKASAILAAWKHYSDPKVRSLLDAGPQAFYRQTAKRILEEYAGEVALNRCPRCDGLCRTPVARQCPHCFHSWHD